MLWPSIIILIMFLIFGITMGFLFLVPLVTVAVNTVILYFLFLRIYTQITKYGKAEIYAFSFAAAALILIIIKNFLPLWWITTAAILAELLANAYRMFERR